MGTNRPTLLENLADTILYVQKRKEATAFGQISLFDEETEASMETFSMKAVEDWKLPEKLEMEKGLASTSPAILWMPTTRRSGSG